MRTFPVALLFFGLPLSTTAAAAPAEAWNTALDGGWLEVIVSVNRPQPMLQFSREVAGWDVLTSRTLDQDQLDFYRAYPESRRSAREWLIADRGRVPGFLRLLQFGDPHAVAIRSGAMPWDTGGVMSIMTRSNATATIYHRAQALGWNAFNDPVELFLPDTGVRLSNVILRGPDAISISVYERLQPRLPDAPDLQKLRRPFNAMQAVRDMSRARHFYEQVLGFEVVNQGDFANPVRAPNNFGTPGNLVVAQPIPFVIVAPRAAGPTHLELVEMRGVEGRDVSSRAQPPNLGLLGFRYPVRDLQTVIARLEKSGWPLQRPRSRLHLEPWGPVDVVAVQSPDGVWLEFMQKVSL